jgi:hypothetical protein
MVLIAKLFEAVTFRNSSALGIALGVRLRDANSGGSREYRPVASIASSNPCPGWALVGNFNLSLETRSS